MPYEPPPSPWMPGDEAIEHIRAVEKYPTTDDAIEQLRLAIVHGAVGAILADMKKPPIGSSGPISVPSDSIPPPEMWKTARINVDGTVLFSGADKVRIQSHSSERAANMGIAAVVNVRSRKSLS